MFGHRLLLVPAYALALVVVLAGLATASSPGGTDDPVDPVTFVLGVVRDVLRGI